MCYILRVSREHRCGHRIVYRRERIDCESATCVLSDSHQLDCRNCYNTCRQSLQDEIRWSSDKVKTPCESCLAGK
ncbi:hypothetical protein FB446DRAFT_107415 [Lentinula raphanica]|nr:hypothetical protein FB446DRAFT_107415 [Lentinula raphanica]